MRCELNVHAMHIWFDVWQDDGSTVGIAIVSYSS